MAGNIDDGRRSFELARSCSKRVRECLEKMWAKAIEEWRSVVREFWGFHEERQWRLGVFARLALGSNGVEREQKSRTVLKE